MTISTTANRISYSGNDVTIEFSFPYKFLDDADLVVVLIDSDDNPTTQVLNTDYTLTGAGDDAGGTVTMIIPPATGETLLMYRDVSITQETDYITGDAFPGESHETALDKLTIICQQLDDENGRGLRLPDSYAGAASSEIPAPEALAYLRWNITADALENTTAVTSVAAVDVPISAISGIAATDVQGALAELNTDKVETADIGTTVQAYDADIPTVAASESEMRAGTETALRSTSPLRVFQAIDENLGMPVRSDATTETLSASDSNTLTVMALSGSDITKTLPALSGVTDGALFSFQIISDSGSSLVTFAPSGSDNIHVDTVAAHDAMYMHDVGDFITFMADTTNTTWRIVYDGVAGPYFEAYYSGSGQSLTVNVETKLQYNTESTDPYGVYDHTTNYRFTPNVPGWYTIHGSAYFSSAASRRIGLNIYKNGSSHRFGNRIGIPSDGVVEANHTIYCNGSTDYIELYGVSYDTGSNFDDAILPFFYAKRSK